MLGRASRPWSTSSTRLLDDDRHPDRLQAPAPRPRACWPATPTARGLRDQLLNTVFGGGTTSMAALGIQTDRYGKLVFDAAAFAKAYAADPAGVAAKFTRGTAPATDGWAARVADGGQGRQRPDQRHHHLRDHRPPARRSTGCSDEHRRTGTCRLELRRTPLERQYTALETALSTAAEPEQLAGQPDLASDDSLRPLAHRPIVTTEGNR